MGSAMPSDERLEGSPARLQLKFLAALGGGLLAWGMSLATSGAGAARPATRSPRRSAPTRTPARSPSRTRPSSKLANSLSPGQTGCLRAGVFQGDVKVNKGGAAGRADHDHQLPGRARDRRRPLPGRRARPTTSRSRASTSTGATRTTCRARRSTATTSTFRANDVTNHHTTICFILGSDTYGRARDTVIERNRIHNCGELPATNHHHGIYVEASDGARITDNWIYDNADRGVQLFPDAQEHLHRAQRDRRQRAGDHLLPRVREQPRREQRHLQPGAALQHRGLGADRRRQRRAPELRLEHSPPGQRRHPAGARGGHAREQGHRARVRRTAATRTSACGRTAPA